MAVFNTSPGAGEFAFDMQDQDALTSPSKHLTTLTNIAGAVVSLALIVGIGVWGYKLLVRDVSGVPVVKAASGEMRVRPEEPGGQLAQHQGLSVNVVAAEGTAAAPADELRLAPQPIDLTQDDHIVPAAMVATAPQIVTSTQTPDVAAALQSGQVDDLVAQLTAGIAPLSGLEGETPTQDAVVTPAAVVVPKPAVSAAVLNAPGVRQSLRPRKRPSQRAVVVQASAPAESADVDAASLPIGTRLAQLGAFDSEAVAREQWDQMNVRFAAYLEGKQRIIQKATSGGRVFYRLRALGFEDIADARRFCSALVSENADCIPVVTR